ncbi:retrovirus-related pol polyprotein from transposon TNT 1-94 [Tanacetum coccineum]
MSSMEAEYIVAAEAAMEAIWIHKFISELGVVPSIDKPMDMYCDNTGAITIADEPSVQKGAKHFQRKYHFIRQVIQEGDIRILKVHTHNNLAGPLTKPMPCTKHVEHARSIRLRPAVLIAPRRNDVYVLDMSLLTPNEACFFVKASECVNWLWHKRLSHLNFKNINKLAKQNKVLSLPSLVYSKDKPYTTCEKRKHHRASFKTKQNFTIGKCLHLLHMDLFGPVSPMSINHEKYTLVIVNEYSRYTWVYFLKKKSQAPEMIMSFIRIVENQNDVKVKQIRTDNGTEFRNHELESFYDEKGISQNLSSPYTPEQNGVAERRNRTLIEATRTMLNGLVLSKHFWTNVDHLGKFDVKADDGYFLGYSSVSKAFRFYNTRRQQIEETYHVTFDESMEAIRNKKDEHGTTTKNKSRLVAQGYSQEEEIDYDETFAPVVIMEAIRIFLAFATYMNFKVYQMDVKSAFQNGKLKEEVYVKQPHGFESSEFPDYVCKLDKALYGKKTSTKAWRSHPCSSVLDGNYSSTEQVNSIQQLLACSLNTRTEVDIREIIYSDLDEAQESDEEVLAAGDDMDEYPQDDKEVRTPSPKQDQPKPSHAIDQLLKEISNAVKDDPATNQKLNEATETFTRISSSVTEVLFLVKGFDFSALLSTMKSIQDHAVKQEEASAAWIETLLLYAWNLGSRLSELNSLKRLLKENFLLKKDTFEINVTPTLALIDIQANVEGENANTTTTEEPPSYTEGETKNPRLAIPISSIPSTIDKGKGIPTEFDDDPSKKQVKASSIVRPDPDEPVRVEFMINGKIVYLTEQEIQDY